MMHKVSCWLRLPHWLLREDWLYMHALLNQISLNSPTTSTVFHFLFRFPLEFRLSYYHPYSSKSPFRAVVMGSDIPFRSHCLHLQCLPHNRHPTSNGQPKIFPFPRWLRPRSHPHLRGHHRNIHRNSKNPGQQKVIIHQKIIQYYI